MELEWPVTMADHGAAAEAAAMAVMMTDAQVAVTADEIGAQIAATVVGRAATSHKSRKLMSW
jgi:hypothetical protein